MSKKDFYCRTTREMLSQVKEVGAMPFVLFEYYLTYENAPEGIRPGLQTICDDLGLEPNAVCNLRKRLIKAGWISYQNGEVFILKNFTKNDPDDSQIVNPDSQKMNPDSQKMNNGFTKNEFKFTNCESGFTKNEFKFTKNESPYIRNENKKRERKEKEKRERDAHAHARRNSLISDSEFLLAYREFFPDYHISIFQQEVILSRARDPVAWREALTFWAGNNYRPGSVEKICNKHDEILKEKSEVKNDAAIQRHSDSRERNDRRISETNEYIERLFREGCAEQNFPC
jgi:hypothetical protein